MPDPGGVVAVVLTYEAPDTVVACIQRLLSLGDAPDHVLVVDNASPTVIEGPVRSVDVDQERVSVLRTPSNNGPAGGFAAGLSWCTQRKFSAAWAMDDDCLPEEGCLTALRRRAAAAQDPSVVLPIEIDGHTGSALRSFSWCGALIPLEIIAKVGVPRPEFFWWGEDTEYLSLRMRRHHVPVLREPDAVVLHQRLRRAGPKPVWKYYYESRNTTYLRFYEKKRGYVRRWALPLVLRFGAVALREEMRAAKLGAMLQGVADGFRKRLGKTFPVS